MPFNVGRPFRLPALPNQLAERILSEADVQRMIHLEPDVRNRTILTLLYASGVRVRELCDLQWKDLQLQGDGEGQIAVFGKGGKTQFVQMPASVRTILMSLKPNKPGR